MRFLRKLYFLVFIQLGVCLWLTWAATQAGDFAKWVEDYSGFTLWTCLVLTIVLGLVAFLARAVVSKTPINWIVYLIFTLSLGFLLAYWQTTRNASDPYVFLGVATVTAVILALFVHVLFTKRDLTFQSVSLYIFGAAFFVTLSFEIRLTDIPMLHTYLFGIFACLWGFYFAWENETVISGARVEWSKEDYVSYAVSIYLNVFTLVLGLADLIRQLIIKARS